MPDLGLVGGQGGSDFDDVPPSEGMEIGGIFIRAGDYIDQIQVLYRNPFDGSLVLGPVHGGNEGKAFSFILSTGEFITQVIVSSSDYIDLLTFRTNLGNFYTYGNFQKTFSFYGPQCQLVSSLMPGTTISQFPTPLVPNLEVFGFFGRSGDYIDAIGFHTRQRVSGLAKIVGLRKISKMF